MDDLHRQRRRDLTEEERETIRDLIIEQTRLLTTIAGDPTLVDDQAEREYRERHNALSSRLIPLGLRCFCVSGSIVPWQYSPHPELETEFNLMQAPFAEILGGPGPRWRLVLYRRDGDPDDLPFLADFVESLGEEAFDVLDSSLERELEVHGTDLMANDRKMHVFECRGGHPTPSVIMYKIEEGAPSVRVVLRVFFETAPGHTIVLLHGYNKGAADSDRRERREANVACRYRRELLEQLDDPTRHDAALASAWSQS